jgi:hypothetical protein
MTGQFDLKNILFLIIGICLFLLFVVVLGMVRMDRHNKEKRNKEIKEGQKIFITIKGLDVLADRFLVNEKKKYTIFLSDSEIDVLQWSRGAGKTISEFKTGFRDIAMYHGINFSFILNSLAELKLIEIHE